MMDLNAVRVGFLGSLCQSLVNIPRHASYHPTDLFNH